MNEELKQGLSAFDNGDYATAFTILLPFAGKGEVKAQVAVGFMYDTGQGTTQHFEKAVKYYTPAAEAGDTKSQYRLGLIYAKGGGAVAQDSFEAYVFLSLAVAEGIKEAIKLRDEMLELLSPSKLEEAQNKTEEMAENYRNKP